MSSTRGRVGVAALVVLALAVVLIATLRPDRQGVGTPKAGASPSASPSPSPSESPSPSPEPSPSPSPAPPPVPPALTARTSARLVIEESTRLRILDVDSGRLTRLSTVPHPNEYDRLDVLAVAGQLVMVGDNNTGAGNGPFPAYMTTAGPGSTLREVGQASSLMPSAHRDRVWLVADNDTNDPQWGTTLTEVDARGVVHQRKQFLHTFGVHPFADGFLREAGDGDKDPQDIELVDRAGKRRHLYPRTSIVDVAGRTAVLSERTPCVGVCELTVLTAGTSITERNVEVEEVPEGGRSVLSPEGDLLYLMPPAEGGRSAGLADLRLTDGGTKPLSDVLVDTNFGFLLQFSPDGRWIFFVDADRRHVDALDRRSRQAYRVKGTFSTFTQITVLPS